MKRFILLISILSISLLAAGCQISAEPEITAEKVKEELKLEKKTGILNVLEEPIVSATHKLTTDLNEDILVRSGSINLRKYERRRVEAEGKRADDNVFEIESITKIGREDDTRELYRNTSLGFSIQYVALWELAERGNEVIFTPYAAAENERVDRIHVARLSNAKKSTPEIWLDLNQNYNSKDPNDDSFYAQVVIGVDQLAGVKKTNKDGTRIDFFAGRENYMYRITHETIEDEDEDKYRNIFFDMVNSFQLVAYDDSAASTVSPVEEIIPVEKPVKKEVQTPASSAPADAAADAQEKPVIETKDLPKLPDENAELGANLESRGFKIKMSYPKSWYWEQVGSELQFTDKPLDEDGIILLKLKKFTYDPEKSEEKLSDEQNFIVPECKEIEKNFYCLISKEAEYGNFEGIMQKMADTIEIRTES